MYQHQTNHGPQLRSVQIVLMNRAQVAASQRFRTSQANRPLGHLTLVHNSSPRLPELDALRGLMLLGMTLTHLPTRASSYAYQPLGFVAWAEGFVFISALLTGRIYGSLLQSKSLRAVVRRLWLRSAKLYAYHVGLLAVAFTGVAAIAVHTQQPALQGLLDFYLAHRAQATISSLFLVYCPPLLDVLPMYIVFLMLTPLILYVAHLCGWKFVITPSALLWLAAQFGVRGAIYGFLVEHVSFSIPLRNLGAFDLYAWQFLWIFGLWVGSRASTQLLHWLNSRWAVVLACVVAAAFFMLRYQLVFATHPIDEGNTWVLFDKWQLGVLRLLNFLAFGVLFNAVRPYIARRLAWGPLVLIGKSSLETFSIHVLFCFVALSLVGDGATAPSTYQVAIVTISLLGLYANAYFLRGRPKTQPSIARPMAVALPSQQL
jgi:hypothetical protein